MSVKLLTREQKELRLKLLQEKIRREKSKKPPFQPNEGQRKVLTSQAKIRLVTSGNGSGKTVLSCVEAVWTAQGTNPLTSETHMVPNKVIYVLDRPGKVNDKLLPELKKFFDTTHWKFHKDGTPSIRRITLPNESEILFMFWEAEPMAWESIDGYSLVVFDEPPPRHAFVGLYRGGRSKGFKTRFLFSGTPIGPNASWLRMELLERWKQGDPDIEVFTFHTEVNKENLADGYIEDFSKALSEKEKAVRLGGEWSDLDGLALAHLWRDEIHLVDDFEWNERHPVVVSIDPHPSKKHHALMLGVDDKGNEYCIKMLIRKEVPRVFARSLREWMQGYRVVDIVCDNLGSAEMTGGEGFKTFIEVLREEGVRVRPTTYEEKHEEDWVTRIQDSLLIPDKPNNFGQKLPKLRVFRSCREIQSDIKNVTWVKIKNLDEYKPTLDIQNKDALSCLKYAKACNLFFDKPRRMEPHVMIKDKYGLMPKANKRRSVKIMLNRRFGRGTSR